MKHQFEIRQLQYFQAVAEELNYHRAAERLFISQPGLSRQIKVLEELLATKLFERNSRNVALTATGKYLQSEVQSLFIQFERIGQQIKLMEQGKSGELRIGFLGSAIQSVLPDLLLNLSRDLPDVDVTLEELSNQHQLQAIEQGRLDLGFMRIAAPKKLGYFEVSKETFSLVLPQGHPLSAKNFEHVGQLKEEPFILFTKDYSPLYFDKIMSICEDQGFQPNVRHRSVHAHTIFKLVENGLGVAIVPTSLQHGYQLGVKFIELKGIPQQTALSAVWKKENKSPVLTRVLTLLGAK